MKGRGTGVEKVFLNTAERKPVELEWCQGLLNCLGKIPTPKQGKNNVVRADGRERWQDSTAVYKQLHKHLPGFSFLKDACNPSILIPTSQSVKDCINISGTDRKQKFCKYMCQ